MRYFIKLAYRGAPFHGWQSQPNAVSVQQTLEEALSVVSRRRVSVTGAGRTDTGVNARVMFAHFDSDIPQQELQSRIPGINRIVGPDIAVYDIIPVADDAHARFDATERTYKYFVSYAKSPFTYPLSWNSPSVLDVEAMNDAAALLMETDDFTSFAKLHSDVKTNICNVRAAGWDFMDDTLGMPGIVFTITADRFLRNMVRAIVGTLVDVGRGKLSKTGFRDIILCRDRCSAGTSMPPQALFLWDIKYDYIIP